MTTDITSLPTEWSVHIEADLDGGPLTEDNVDDLTDWLADHGASVAFGDGINLTLSVSALDFRGAADEAIDTVAGAVEKLGRDFTPGAVRRCEVLTAAELERDLDTPQLPEVVGVTEIGEMLNLSKQRAHAIAHSARFPDPLFRLANGSVWAKPAVERFAETWDRRPGRPRADRRQSLDGGHDRADRGA